MANPMDTNLEDKFQEDLNTLIDKYRDFKMSYASVVGVIEIVQMGLAQECSDDEDEPEKF